MRLDPSARRRPLIDPRSGFTHPPLVLALAAVSVMGGLLGLWHTAEKDSATRVEAAQEGPDTMVVFGPRRFEVERGEVALHVEEFSVVPRPGAQYLIVVENGGQGGRGVESSHLVLNGVEELSGSERLDRTGTVVEDVGVEPANELAIELRGEAGSFVTLTVYEVVTAESPVVAEISSLNAARDQRVALALSPREGAVVDALLGEVRFDPSRLEYLGVDPETDAYVLVNANEPGRLGVLALDPLI